MSETTEYDGFEFVTTLHDVVQPAGVPVLPMIDLEGRICVPGDASEPGGGWFDVVVLPDDRLGMVVGEAPGVGLASAVTAAQMRAVIRAGLRRDGDVVAALRLADIHAEDLPDARGTTAMVVLLDPERGSATYATAGHAPPLVRPAHGPATPLDDTGGGPLGTGDGTGYSAATHPWRAGDIVLLASAPAHRAGPVELPEAGEESHDDTFADLHRTANAFADQLAADDTLCLIAARLRPARHRDLALRLNAEPGAVRRAREELGSWLAGLRASPMDEMALTHAAAELVTNAVEHGGQGNEQRIEVQARLGSDGVVLVEVLDHGSWLAPSEDLDRGRGLAMAAGLVDHLGVSTGPGGTRAYLLHRLLRPVPIEPTEPGVREGPWPEAVEVVHTGPQNVSLRGAFGHDDVERVSAEILVATRGGTLPLALDLTAVTRLSTSAVRLLAALTSVNRSVGRVSADIDITSAANSVTQRTLDIARVPHHAG